MSHEGQTHLDLRTATGEEINAAIGDGVMDALRRHKEAGRTVIAWVDGKIAEIPADLIRVPPESTIEPNGTPDGHHEIAGQ
jgi:hypothetical protein